MQQLIWPLVVGFLLSLAAGPIILPILRRLKMGQSVRDDGPQTHLIKQGTPTIGGLIFLIGGLGSALLFTRQSYGFAIFAVLITLGFGAVGFLDDFIKVVKHRSLGLKAYQKIIGQLGLAILVAVFAAHSPEIGTELYVPFAGLVDFGSWYIPFVVFIVVGMVNSVNLTDGLDGLAGGMGVIVCAGFAITAYTLAGDATASGQVLKGIEMNNMAVFGAAMAGACPAFLRFNAHPAKVFMGDTGSLALGAAISVLAVTTRMIYLLPVMGFMYILSTISVILQVGSFKLRHKRVFRMAPLHHHFELKGMHETRIVVMYYAWTLAFTILGIVSLASL